MSKKKILIVNGPNINLLGQIEKNVYGEEIENKLKLLDHPRIQNAIKHAKRAGEL